MIERFRGADLFIKIAAIILALVVWVQVVNDRNPLEIRSLNLPLEYNLPEGRVLMSASADRVSVTLEGRSHTLDVMVLEKPDILMDLSETEVGESVVPVTFRPPYGVTILDVNPSSVTIDQDAFDKKAVPVNIQPKGVPDEEFEAGKPIYSYETVEVQGPKRQVEKVAWAIGEIDVEGAKQEVVDKVMIFPRDAFNNTLSKVTVIPKEIDVEVPLIQRPPAKVVPVRVDIRGTPKTGYRFETGNPEPQFVRIRAPEEVISKVSSLTVGPIDVTGKDQSFVYANNLNVPEGITWVETPQVKVTVNIVEDIIERRFNDIIVTPKEPMPGLRFNVSPARVDVVLGGRRDIISELKSSDIEAYVDARDRGQGEYRLRVALTLPNSLGVNITDINPMYVTLVLEER